MERSFRWDASKDAYLRATRGISFDEIVELIRQGNVLVVIEQPSPEKYPGQQIAVVRVDDYAYVVPFIDQGDVVLLKTIIPSRKATKKYLRKE